MGDVKYTFEADTTQATAQIKAVQKQISESGTTADSSHVGFAKLSGAIAAGQLAYEKITGAIGSYIKFGKDCIENAMDEEEAENNLRNALASSGREVESNATHLLGYAQQLSKTTRFTHEQVQGAQALLVQLGLSPKYWDEATRGAIGLARTFNIDLESATRMVAKAFEGNYTALQRVGVQVKGAATEEEKLALIKEKLSQMYERATRETHTFRGVLDQSKKAYDEIKEAVGAYVTKNEDLKGSLGVITGLFNVLKEAIERNIGPFGFFAKGVGFFVKETLAQFGAGLYVLMKPMMDQIEMEKRAEGVQRTWNLSLSAGKEIIDALKQSGGDFTGALEILRKKTIETTIPVDKLREYAKGLGITIKDDLKLQLKEAEEGFKKLAASGQLTAEGANAAQNKIHEIRQQLQGLGKLGETELGKPRWQIQALLEIMADKFPGKARNMGLVMSQAADGMTMDAARVRFKWDTVTTAIAEKWQKTIDKVKVVHEIFTNQIDAISQQYYTNQDIRIENEYKKRREAIEKSTMSEEEKQAAIEKLDSEMEARRRQAAQSQAKYNKVIALAGAIINTAEAVTKSLSAAPFPLNVVLAAATAALGAAQIALIAKQPIPLARGGIFPRPTVQLAEEEPEAVLPLSRLNLMLRERGMGGPGAPRLAQVHVYIGSEKIESRVVSMVGKNASLGRLKLSGRGMR